MAISGIFMKPQNLPYFVDAVVAAVLTLVFPLPGGLIYLVIAGVATALITGFMATSQTRAMRFGGAFGFILVLAHFFIYRPHSGADIANTVVGPLVMYGFAAIIAGVALGFVANKIKPRA